MRFIGRYVSLSFRPDSCKVSPFRSGHYSAKTERSSTQSGPTRGVRQITDHMSRVRSRWRLHAHGSRSVAHTTRCSATDGMCAPESFSSRISCIRFTAFTYSSLRQAVRHVLSCRHTERQDHIIASYRPLAQCPDLSLSRSMSSAPTGFAATHAVILAISDLSMATAFSSTYTPGTPRLSFFSGNPSRFLCRRLCRRRSALQLSLCSPRTRALCIRTTINLASASESSFMSPSSDDRTAPPCARDILCLGS